MNKTMELLRILWYIFKGFFHAQIPLIRDEILLVLKEWPEGLPIDLLWPEIRQVSWSKFADEAISRHFLI